MNGSGYTGGPARGTGGGSRMGTPQMAPDMLAKLRSDFTGGSPDQQASMWRNQALRPFLNNELAGLGGGGAAGYNTAMNRLEGSSWTAQPFDASQYGIAPRSGAGGMQAKPMMDGASGSASNGAMGGRDPAMLAQALRRLNPAGGSMASDSVGMSMPGASQGGVAGGSGTSGRGGFNFGQQTEMGGMPGGGGVMGQMGSAAPGASGSSSGFGGGRMYAGGSPTFNENAGLLGQGASQMAPGQFMSPWGQMQGQGQGWSGFAAPQPGASGQVWY